MSSSFGMIIELLVALLLFTTIAYCVLLNKKLKTLRADGDTFRVTIQEIVRATAQAERAISGLREAAAECNASFAPKFEEAAEMHQRIHNAIINGQKMIGLFKEMQHAMDTAKKEADFKLQELQQFEPDWVKAAPAKEENAYFPNHLQDQSYAAVEEALFEPDRLPVSHHHSIPQQNVLAYQREENSLKSLTQFVQSIN